MPTAALAPRFEYHQRDNFWLRLDPCHCTLSDHRPSDVIAVHTSRAGGRGDLSPVWDKLTSYDPKCSACWLNITHSTASHLEHLEHLESA